MTTLVHTTRLGRWMDARQIEAVVATSSANVFYFTGMRSVSLQMLPRTAQCYAVLTRGALEAPALVASQGEIDQLLDISTRVTTAASFGRFYREAPPDVSLTDDEVLLQRWASDAQSFPDPAQALAYVLAELGLTHARIAVDEDGLMPQIQALISAKYPGTTLVPAAEGLRWVRRVKTADEISRLASAATLLEEAILEAAASATVGVRELDIAKAVNANLARSGALPCVTLVRFGRNGVAGQVAPGQTRLRDGDTLWFDVMSVLNGYWADIARTFSIGEPAPRAHATYDALLEGVDQTIAIIRPGMLARDIHSGLVTAVRSAGLVGYRRHHVGHGIGLEVYESPMLSDDGDDVIESGAVLSIEAPYYEFGLGALHVEDPVLVSAHGAARLTRADRHLAQLG